MDKAIIYLSKSFLRLAKKSNGFNLDIVEEIDDPKEAIEYVGFFYNLIGGYDSDKGTGAVGSTRVVFDYGGGKVIKVAYNSAGIAANNMEARISKSSPLFTKVFYLSPSARVIIAEKLTPFKSEAEFESFTGVKPSALEFAVFNINDFELDKKIIMKDFGIDLKSYNLTAKIARLILSNNLIRFDSIDPLHWGVSDSGKLKLYDYGTDNYLFGKHLYTINKNLYNEIKNKDKSFKYEPTRSEAEQMEASERKRQEEIDELLSQFEDDIDESFDPNQEDLEDLDQNFKD